MANKIKRENVEKKGKFYILVPLTFFFFFAFWTHSFTFSFYTEPWKLHSQPCIYPNMVWTLLIFFPQILNSSLITSKSQVNSIQGHPQNTWTVLFKCMSTIPCVHVMNGKKRSRPCRVGRGKEDMTTRCHMVLDQVLNQEKVLNQEIQVSL